MSLHSILICTFVALERPETRPVTLKHGVEDKEILLRADVIFVKKHDRSNYQKRKMIWQQIIAAGAGRNPPATALLILDSGEPASLTLPPRGQPFFGLALGRAALT
ncbi:hypothetical protein [Sodalis sp. RH16]|uniref:hypothetical protein n=1 Tax=Sodalis sp. RH16 TaxID=3394331 RepID=UPI0039B4E54E